MISLSFKLPGSRIPWELPAQSHRQLPSSSLVRRRPPSAFLSTPSPRHQTSLVFRHSMHCRYTPVLSMINPRPRISPRAFPKKNSRLPLTPRIKLPMIRVMTRTLNGFRMMMCSQHYPHSVKCSLGCLQKVPLTHVKRH